MNKLANRMILIAAGALMLGSVSYGQTVMTAKIPFAFRASRTTMPAGEYQVTERVNAGVVVMTMRNAAANRNAIAIGGPVDWGRDGNARITFTCRKDDCVLSQIRAGFGSVSYPSDKPRAHDQLLSTISVPMSAVHGD